MKNALIFLADGLEEIEAVTQVDLLRRAGINVITTSILNTKEVTGSHNIIIMADEIINNVKDILYDIIILPGGQPGTDNLMKNEIVREIIINHNDNNKYIASICAAPSILLDLGLLKDKNYTCYPGYEDIAKGKKYKENKVVLDNNIITGKGVGAAIDFALNIIKVLCSNEISESIKEKIVY